MQLTQWGIPTLSDYPSCTRARSHLIRTHGWKHISPIKGCWSEKWKERLLGREAGTSEHKGELKRQGVLLSLHISHPPFSSSSLLVLSAFFPSTYPTESAGLLGVPCLASLFLLVLPGMRLRVCQAFVLSSSLQGLCLKCPRPNAQSLPAQERT